MIYRILASLDNREVYRGRMNDEFITDDLRLSYVPLSGAQRLLSEEMWRAGLPVPRMTIAVPRARFWFTEMGWKRYGLPLLHQSRRHRYFIMQVLSDTNPDRSRIVYADEVQVALLPKRSPSRRADRAWWREDHA
jgi:hypothetical protein